MIPRITIGGPYPGRSVYTTSGISFYAFYNWETDMEEVYKPYLFIFLKYSHTRIPDMGGRPFRVS